MEYFEQNLNETFAIEAVEPTKKNHRRLSPLEKLKEAALVTLESAAFEGVYLLPPRILLEYNPSTN